MRHTARFIAILAAALATPAWCSAQTVSGEYIVGARVISDVAVRALPAAQQAPPAPEPTEASPSDVAVPATPAESYPQDGVVIGEYPVAEGEYLGEGEYVSEGEYVAGGSQAGQRLHYLVHGGEQGQFIPKQYPQPELFYNYYSNGQNQVNAEMYLSPVPVPPFVGNTWYTYQPLMPHNYLYPHTDTYHNHYDYGRGTNRTRVKYSVSLQQYKQSFINNFRLPR